MIEPVIHRILVKLNKVEEVDETFKNAKAAGIFIPELEQRQREQASVDTGIVVDMGPTVFQDFHTENPLKKGDHVAFARFAGKFVKDPYTKEEFVMLNDEDIVAIFRKD